eukprot:2728937-Amphidinium_carterae.1
MAAELEGEIFGLRLMLRAIMLLSLLFKGKRLPIEYVQYYSCLLLTQYLPIQLTESESTPPPEEPLPTEPSTFEWVDGTWDVLVSHQRQPQLDEFINEELLDGTTFSISHAELDPLTPHELLKLQAHVEDGHATKSSLCKGCL